MPHLIFHEDSLFEKVMWWSFILILIIGILLFLILSKGWLI